MEGKIVLNRIDNRLLHGQIYAGWIKYVDASSIVIANDDAAASPFKQGLMDMAAPTDIRTHYWSLPLTIVRLREPEDDKRILLITATPEDTLKLVEAGVPIEKINIGNMQLLEGKRAVTPSVAVSREDVEAFRKLRDLGCKLEMRRLPTDQPDDLADLFLD